MYKIQINYLFLIIVLCFSSMSSQNLIFEKFREQKNAIIKGDNWQKATDKIKLNSFKGQKEIYLNKPNLLELEVTDNFGTTFILDLYKVDIVSNLAKSRYRMKNEEVFYRGVLRSDNNSIVSLAVFKEQINLSIYSKGNSYKLKGSIKKSKNNYKLIKTFNKNIENLPTGCDIVYEEESFPLPAPYTNNGYNDSLKVSATKDMIFNSGYIGVYLEVDDDIVNNSGGLEGANQYIMDLFNVVSSIYANEGIDVRLSDIFFWETTSPYTGDTSGELLSQFVGFRKGNWEGNIGQLLSAKTFQGTAAGLGKFCRIVSPITGTLNTDGMSIAGLFTTGPVSDQTLNFFIAKMAHEMGHSLGSRHTHDCIWNGDDTVIDGCGQAAGSPCPLGPIPDKYTIMSGCNRFLPITFDEGFGPQPGNLIRNLIFNNIDCLTQSTNTIKVSPKVVLQGAMLNSTGNLMRDDLRSQGYLPVRSPYEDNIPVGSDVFEITGDDAIVDWVFIELRSASDNTNIVASQSALLQRDGDVVNVLGVNELDFDLPAGNYYVVVKHRNHLGIMTNVAQQLSATTRVVDFTNSNVVVYGNNARTSFSMPSGVLGMWAGDASQNGVVNIIGTGNDANVIRDVILNDPINAPIQFYGYTVPGYNNADVNLTGGTNMISIGNDSNVLRDNILNHPVNMFLQFYGFSIVEQLPGSGNNRNPIPSLNKTTFKQTNFAIIPNPNNGVFTVMMSKNEVIDEISIMDMNGAKVLSSFEKGFDGEINIDASMLQSGMYVIVITSSGITKRKQLIIN